MDSHTGAALRASLVLHSLLAADSSPSFHEPSMVDFSGIRPGRRRSAAESDESEAEHPGRQPEKKRRLTAAQVQFLERSFEVDNKLEPERKNELAKDLHLQPRQVAIWFQNRRARFKTKQLERDYAALQSTFDSLKSHYDHLLNHKDQLQNEVNLLRAKLKLREGNLNSGPHMEALPVKVEVACKLEEASSAKSDVFDSESPHSTSHVYEAEFSRADLTGGFMAVADYGFGEAVEGDFQGGSCGGLGLPGLEGHPAYWPWLY